MKAIFNNKIVADSENTISFEGNTYFPPESISRKYFKEIQNYTTTCLTKGQATYYTIAVDGEIRDHASWVYHHPSPEAQQIAGYFAFWKGVSIRK